MIVHLKVLSLLLFAQIILAQDEVANDPAFAVKPIYHPISIDRQSISQAKSLIDLHPRFPSKWIRTYLSTAVSTNNQGIFRQAKGRNGALTAEQQQLLTTAIAGVPISVEVVYIPENDLKENDPKTIDFTIHLLPEHPANFPGGFDALQKYLEEIVSGQLPAKLYTGYDLTAITFTVDTQGKIATARTFWPSGHPDADERLLAAVLDMPAWQPATNKNGLPIAQEFVFLVGNMDNCALGTLPLER